MQSMLKAHDTLFRVWELAVSFLGLPPLPLVPGRTRIAGKLSKGERSGLQTHIAATENAFIVRADDKLRTFLELESAAAIQLVRLPWRQG